MSEVISVVLLVLVLVELHFSPPTPPPPPPFSLTGSGKCSKRQSIQWSALSARNTRTAPKKRRTTTVKTNEKDERDEREVKESYRGFCLSVRWHCSVTFAQGESPKNIIVLLTAVHKHPEHIQIWLTTGKCDWDDSWKIEE